MLHLRTLVQQGMPIEQAAAEVGIDPLIASLWARLPEELLSDIPAARTPAVPPVPPLTPRPPRYLTERAPNGLKRVIRADGLPLCSDPPSRATRAVREQR